MSSSSVAVSELFDESRYPNGGNFLTFIIYFPFGAMFAMIRIFISLQMFLIAAIFQDVVSVKNFIINTMCNILGIVVRENHVEEKDKNANVFVANHLTPLDFLAFHISTGCVSPKSKLLPSALNWIIGYKDLGLEHGFQRFSEYMQNHSNSTNSTPILLQPEGSTTNGRKGLLQFQQKYLDDVKIVQPIALNIWRPPIGSVSSCVLGSSWWTEIFWFFFVPCTVFSLTYLPTIKRGKKEDSETFTDRVEEVIAKHLGLERTKYTVADKLEEEKKLLRVPQRVPRTSVNSELQRMVSQVAEVLPYVPSDVVLKDLLRTRSVDITISNILEGHITYMPLSSNVTASTTVESKSAPTGKTTSNINISSKIGESSSLDTSAPTFAKSAQERNLSFLERKNKLIENARRRYIEKHGLKVGLSTVKFG